MRDVKSNSSAWLKDGERSISYFAWQAGYGAFSVDPTRLNAVRQDIEGQEEHHRKTSFQDEFRSLLEERGVTWDERHVWD